MSTSLEFFSDKFSTPSKFSQCQKISRRPCRPFSAPRRKVKKGTRSSSSGHVVNSEKGPFFYLKNRAPERPFFSVFRFFCRFSKKTEKTTNFRKSGKNAKFDENWTFFWGRKNEVSEVGIREIPGRKSSVFLKSGLPYQRLINFFSTPKNVYQRKNVHYLYHNRRHVC